MKQTPPRPRRGKERSREKHRKEWKVSGSRTEDKRDRSWWWRDSWAESSRKSNLGVRTKGGETSIRGLESNVARERTSSLLLERKKEREREKERVAEKEGGGGYWFVFVARGHAIAGAECVSEGDERTKFPEGGPENRSCRAPGTEGEGEVANEETTPTFLRVGETVGETETGTETEIEIERQREAERDSW